MHSKQRTRRQFLKEAATMAAAALAGPTILPSTALGHSGRAAPSERIVVALIGSGAQGTLDIRNVAGRSGGAAVQVIAVCDVDKAKREAAQQVVTGFASGKGCAAYSDFREVLALDDLNAVVVGTPDHWHPYVTVAAVKAGCDVYCEKPLTRYIGQGRPVVDAVARYGRVLQTGSQQRTDYGGVFRTACELVRNGYIGKLKEIFVNVQGPSAINTLPAEPVPAGLDWDMWLGPAPWQPYNKGLHPFNWRGFRDFGGGGMTDMGAHHFDIAQWGMDADATGPVEIHPPDGKDYPLLTYVYANGVRMYHSPGLSNTQLKPPANMRGNVIFVGDKGVVSVSRRSLEASPRSLLSVKFGPSDLRLPVVGNHYENWLDCIVSRKQPICPPEVGNRSATVCHLGCIAYWLNRPLKWDPAKEQFVGDEEANRWVNPPARAPWSLT